MFSEWQPLHILWHLPNLCFRFVFFQHIWKKCKRWFARKFLVQCYSFITTHSQFEYFQNKSFYKNIRVQQFFKMFLKIQQLQIQQLQMKPITLHFFNSWLKKCLPYLEKPKKKIFGQKNYWNNKAFFVRNITFYSKIFKTYKSSYRKYYISYMNKLR